MKEYTHKELEGMKYDAFLSDSYFVDDDDDYDFGETKDVIIKEQRTSKGRVRLYKCPHCDKIIPRDAWYEDCMFCFGSINWYKARG